MTRKESYSSNTSSSGPVSSQWWLWLRTAIPPGIGRDFPSGAVNERTKSYYIKTKKSRFNSRARALCN
ncbi:MAG: hypothetical protein A2915_00500 [Candidatus Yanofskybacteria bacterium RIFCSPLOWO2_01_FULL_41_34]|nr:MAG: hypothetical protein A2915_00500 [Candidatus Yanofskybacteria bacterium RIFCSPLOWO2_01_FULL_41_34]